MTPSEQPLVGEEREPRSQEEWSRMYWEAVNALTKQTERAERAERKIAAMERTLTVGKSKAAIAKDLAAALRSLEEAREALRPFAHEPGGFFSVHDGTTPCAHCQAWRALRD